MKFFIGTIILMVQWHFAPATLNGVGRIMNGNISEEIPPYHATLLISNTLEPTVDRLGSGVLISRKHILTTAFNIYGFNGWSAGFGSLNYWNLVYFVANGAIVHEEFNRTTLANNIGVLFFNNGVYLDNVLPAVLPSEDYSGFPQTGMTGKFSAFSFTDYLGIHFSDIMLESVQTVVSDTECLMGIDNVFCGIDFVHFSSPCGGEQGAGFIVNQNDENIVAGIVSAVTRICNALDSKTIFIRVANYRSWISKMIGI